MPPGADQNGVAPLASSVDIGQYCQWTHLVPDYAGAVSFKEFTSASELSFGDMPQLSLWHGPRLHELAVLQVHVDLTKRIALCFQAGKPLSHSDLMNFSLIGYRICSASPMRRAVLTLLYEMQVGVMESPVVLSQTLLITWPASRFDSTPYQSSSSTKLIGLFCQWSVSRVY